MHSITGFTVKNLQFLRTSELIIAQTIPMKIEKNAKVRKPPSTLNGVLDVNSLPGPAYSYTVLKRIMQTASFVMPSPKTKLKSLGYSSYLMIEIAATTSVQHSNEHMSIISMPDKVNCSYSL